MSGQIMQSRRMRTDITITTDERARLAGLIVDRNSPAKVVWRARIVLATAGRRADQGDLPGNGQVETVRMALAEAVRRGRRRRAAARQDAAAGAQAVSGRDEGQGAGQDRTRDAGRCDALERAHDGKGDRHQPHQRAAHLDRGGPQAASDGKFKVSNDPYFDEKVRDIVGLYMTPPDRALVLCVDEKSQIQALDRTQPGLPLKKGRAATMTHDYKRHGMTTLYAAMDVTSGHVIGDCQPRHRAREFLAFLRPSTASCRSNATFTSSSTTPRHTRPPP